MRKGLLRYIVEFSPQQWPQNYVGKARSICPVYQNKPSRNAVELPNSLDREDQAINFEQKIEGELIIRMSQDVKASNWTMG